MIEQKNNGDDDDMPDLKDIELEILESDQEENGPVVDRQSLQNDESGVIALQEQIKVDEEPLR